MHILIASLGEVESDDESIFSAPDENWTPRPVNVSTSWEGNGVQKSMKIMNSSSRSCSDSSISTVCSTASSSSSGTNFSECTPVTSCDDIATLVNFDHPKENWLDLTVQLPCTVNKRPSFYGGFSSNGDSSTMDSRKVRRNPFDRKISISSMNKPLPEINVIKADPLDTKRVIVSNGDAKTGPILARRNCDAKATDVSEMKQEDQHKEEKSGVDSHHSIFKSSTLSYLEKSSVLFSDYPVFDTLPEADKISKLDNEIAQYRKETGKLKAEIDRLSQVINNRVEFYKHDEPMRLGMLEKKDKLIQELQVIEKKRYEKGLQLTRVLKKQRKQGGAGADIWVRSR